MSREDPLAESSHRPAKDQELVRAPRGVGTTLMLMAAAIIGIALYLIAVRSDALFADLAALSGLLFCF